MKRWTLPVVVCLLTALSARGDDTDQKPPEDPGEKKLQVYDEVEVKGRADDLVGIASSATEGTTGYLDLQKRPLLRPGELVETTPGVIATQHSGGGKANQYFLRGFNLDHGTDFSVRVAGVPVNLPSHGHGQGYADLNFLIPELVDRVRFQKGPYDAAMGDFSAAGGVEMELVRTLPERLVELDGGSHDFGRLLYAQGFETLGGDLLTAAEVFHDDGPWHRGNDYQGWKGLVSYRRGGAQRGFQLTAMGYDATWLSTDQIPRRAVTSGLIDRFELIDPGPRGDTRRFSLSAQIDRGTDDTLTRWNGYLVRSDFGLVSDFTYFLEDEQDGDQFEQSDRRLIAGLELARTWLGLWGGRRLETTVGAQTRYDDVDNGLFRTRELVRTRTVRSDAIRQLSGGVYAETLIHWSDKVRSRVGLRGDVFAAQVRSDLAANSGDADDFRLGPKLSLILGPWRRTEVYLNLGEGFHSNDARGATVTIDPATGDPAERVEPLVRARGIDVGMRTTAIPGLQTTLTFFQLELDSELVFVGDGGATEASRPSRRRGVEWTNAYDLNRWLALDLDVTFTDAKFTDEAPEGDEIPGAIGTTVAAGLALSDWKGFFGSLRWRYFADVPLIEDGSVTWSSSSLLNARLGYSFENGVQLALEIFNLLDSQDSDIEYYYASRLPGEPAGGVEDVHFHPLESRSARLIVTWKG
ncbi:MAG: TonB-dependent receptor [Thermoanaerobaculia bacterium]|nr:TonB-dependent receptor [Thermoanaerobaculia bacterium]